MIRIMFVCLGNICRSPMAEILMRELLEKEHLTEEFVPSSAATSGGELGNPVYPPVRALLTARGLSCKGKVAVRLREEDYDSYDYFIGMDARNRRDMQQLFHGDPEGKVSLLLDYTDHPRDVADPWYTRDFHAAEADIESGCAALLNKLRSSL